MSASSSTPPPTRRRTISSDLANFILDLDDEDCPHSGLHLAAYQGDDEMLLQVLQEPDCDIDSRIRPFQATPLRLAATGADQGCSFFCLSDVCVLTVCDSVSMLQNEVGNNTDAVMKQPNSCITS